MDNYNYNKRLKHFANSNRKNMTKSEACLWKHVLSARKMLGYQFRRQRPIGNYIADFVCLPLGLVIEVDGITHHSIEAKAKDDKRDSDLAALGFTTLRFSALDVLNEIEVVSMGIGGWIKENAKCPPPNPRQRGKRVSAKQNITDNCDD